MSAFYDNHITDLGRMLLGDIQMGASFVPTKIVIGKGYMPQGKTTQTMTDVVDVVKELSLNKAIKNPDGDAIFGAIFTNEDVQQAFYYRELALYAKGIYFNESGGIERETGEILYSYGNAGDNAELIPAYSTGMIVERQLDLLVYIGNDAEVHLKIETGLYVTIPVFNDTIEQLKKDIEEVQYIVDSMNFKKYQWGMENGVLSLDEVDGADKVNIARQETLDEVKSLVETIDENTNGLGQQIGTTTDTCDGISTGTTFGKLNFIISYLKDNVFQVLTRIEGYAKRLNDVFPDAAVQNLEKINAIDTKIGEPEDTSAKPTIFGKLAELKQIILEKASEIISAVTGFVDKIGNPGDSNSTDTVFGKLQNIGYIKGSDGSWYETIFKAGAKTLPLVSLGQYQNCKAICFDTYGVYMYVSGTYLISSGNNASYLAKINMSTGEVVFLNQVVAAGNIIADSSYVYIIAVGTTYTLYKLSATDGHTIGSVTSISKSDFFAQDTSYIYTGRYDKFYKISKSNLSKTESTYAFGSNKNITHINAESSYLYVATSDNLYKFDKNNLANYLAMVSITTGINYSYFYNNNLYVINTRDEMYRYDTSLKLLETLSMPTLADGALSYTPSSVKNRNGSIVYVADSGGRVTKMNLLNPSAGIYADSSAPSMGTNTYSCQCIARYNSEIIYLDVDEAASKFRLVKLKEKETGVSNITGYQEVLL